MDDLGAGSGDLQLEVGGRGQEPATGIVHGDPLELFAVAEPLNEEVQFPGGIRGNQGGHGFLEAIGQDGGSPLQVGRKAGPLLPNLVERENNRHQGEHENEGHDKPDRYFHACPPVRAHWYDST